MPDAHSISPAKTSPEVVIFVLTGGMLPSAEDLSENAPTDLGETVADHVLQLFQNDLDYDAQILLYLRPDAGQICGKVIRSW